jgi:hypothetical protein
MEQKLQPAVVADQFHFKVITVHLNALKKLLPNYTCLKILFILSRMYSVENGLPEFKPYKLIAQYFLL